MLKVDQANRFKELEQEKAGLKRLLAEAELDNAILLARPKLSFPSDRRRPRVSAEGNTLAKKMSTKAAKASSSKDLGGRVSGPKRTKFGSTASSDELMAIIATLQHELVHGERAALREAARRAAADLSTATARDCWINQTADGWLKVVTAAGTLALPSNLKVSNRNTTSGRDYFTILEGVHRGVDANVLTGNFSSTNPLVGPVNATFEANAGRPTIVDGHVFDKLITLRFVDANGVRRTVGPHPARTDPKNPIPRGVHTIEIPDFPHGPFPQYGDFNSVWFRIGSSGDRYVHAGHLSDGCATCLPKFWPSLYRALILGRKGDNRSVGDLTVR